MIAKAQVLQALMPWLGSELALQLDEPIERITRMLNAWSPRQDLQELSDAVNSLLFRAVHDATEGRMLIRVEDGWVRVRVEDFAVMADDALYPLFDSLPVEPKYLLILRDHSMRCESLSSLRAQYLRFAALQSPQELAAIGSFVKKCYPAYRWREWLEESNRQ